MFLAVSIGLPLYILYIMGTMIRVIDNVMIKVSIMYPEAIF